MAGDGVLGWVSNALCLGPTEKEKREKASQEGGDVLGGGRVDRTPSLKNRESWAGETAGNQLRDMGSALHPEGPTPSWAGVDLFFYFCFVVK